ncbi:hypothetical protein FHU28_002584 [Micromonospora echinospora]|uniref:Uncharacterized protein n=1 Tax=Micromonospora echinospora TaxID=1877 RepID=A0ABR6MDM7_MICEC|nr:hypothetical protein [Micromonospora echinospora]
MKLTAIFARFLTANLMITARVLVLGRVERAALR